MATMREFTIWLSQQDGFRSRIRTPDADYFNLSRRDEAEARAAPARPAPSFKQARRAFDLMPASSAKNRCAWEQVWEWPLELSYFSNKYITLV